jgi:type II secretory pathway pseudopilin PulG
MKLPGNPQIVRNQQLRKQAIGGFTSLEMLVVVIIIGIIFAILAPAWLSLLNAQRLNIAQDKAFQAIRSAQQKAKLNRIIWQVSFRQASSGAQWVVHPDNILPEDSLWNDLDPDIQIDDQETTLYKSHGIHRVQFNYLGAVNGQLGRLTLKGKSGGRVKRCIVVATLLGALRKGSEHSTPQEGKYCY